MRRRSTPNPGSEDAAHRVARTEQDMFERPTDPSVHSTLLASLKIQLSHLTDEAVDAFGRLDLAEGRRTSSAIREALARLDSGAVEVLALLRDDGRSDS